MKDGWERIAVFCFGVVFVSVLLALVLLFPKLSPEAYTVFRIVIALAAAGIGAVIPGFLDVHMKGLLRAGGAMALFVIVYFFSPAPPTQMGEPQPPPNPNGNAQEVIDNWLALVDKERYSEAWSSSSKTVRLAYEEKSFIDVFVAQRRPLGNPMKRVLYGLQSLSALPTGQKGNFRVYTYRTTFSSGSDMLEAIALTPEENVWKVFNHNIGPIPK